MTKVKIVIVFLFALSFLSAKTKVDQPNFVFILTDDHRYDVLGCTGNDIVKTPNIDRIANQGTLFTNAHVTSPICTPSRISMLLSQFERKHGVNFNSGTSMSTEAWDLSYPMVMRDNGYYTGYVGKNHSPVGNGGYTSGVLEESFDYWYAGHKHLGFYSKDSHKIFRQAKHDTQAEIMTEGVTDFFSNEYRLGGALHFLDARPKDQPFCLSICFNLPHDSSIGGMKQKATDSVIYRDLYRDQELLLPEGYIAKEDIKTPKLPLDIHFAAERQGTYNYVDTPEKLRENMTRYLQAVTGVDGLVGKLLDNLETLGLDENTIIVFASDHGIFWGEYGLGGKSLCYELCTHIPMIMYNPLLKKSKGRRNSELVQSIDIAPTLLDYAGIEAPSSFQGKSLRGMIEGDDTPVRDYLFTENLWSTQFGNPRCEAVQDKEWKYIRYYANHNLPASEKVAAAKMIGMPHLQMLYKQHDPDIATYRHYAESFKSGEKVVYEELYHLSVDPLEANNVINDEANTSKLEELRQAWKHEVTVARGEGNPKVLRYTNDSQLEIQPL